MICNKCGNAIPQDSIYCPFCRAPIDRDREKKELLMSIQKKNSIIKMLIAACVLLGALAVYEITQVKYSNSQQRVYQNWISERDNTIRELQIENQALKEKLE